MQNAEVFFTVNVPVVMVKLKSVENVSFDVLNVTVSLDVLSVVFNTVVFSYSTVKFEQVVFSMLSVLLFVVIFSVDCDVMTTVSVDSSVEVV